MNNSDEINKYWTFSLAPHGAKQGIFEVKIKYATLRRVCWGILLFVVLAVLLFVYSATLSKRLVNYKMMLSFNREQERQLLNLSHEAGEMRAEIQMLAEKEDELRRLLGLRLTVPRAKNAKKPEKNHSASQTAGKIIVSPQRRQIDKNIKMQAFDISSDFEQARDEIASRKKSLAELNRAIKEIKDRFVQTPSLWPVFGNVISGFGYRYSPWRGFHTGVDITSWYGAPVRATAAGVVSYVGWRTGYGKTVEIDHGFGVSTLYGHNSQLQVRVGQKVKKGQVIANVGTTGFSTGPHCHYEIRRHGVPINPVAYLGLKLFSASRGSNQ